LLHDSSFFDRYLSCERLIAVVSLVEIGFKIGFLNEIIGLLEISASKLKLIAQGVKEKNTWQTSNGCGGGEQN
jgi:hypothetical protein